jgi:hypothetical protein
MWDRCGDPDDHGNSEQRVDGLTAFPRGRRRELDRAVRCAPAPGVGGGRHGARLSGLQTGEAVQPEQLDVRHRLGVFGRSWRSAGGLVVAVWVEGELAEEFAGFGVDDAGVEIGDEDVEARAGVFAAEADVAESAVVAQGHDPGGVDAVAADAVVPVQARSGGVGLGSGGVGLGRGGAGQCPMRPDGVVVAAEPVVKRHGFDAASI